MEPQSVIHLVVRFIPSTDTPSQSQDLNLSHCMCSPQCCAIGTSNHTRLFRGIWNPNLDFNPYTASSVTHLVISTIIFTILALCLYPSLLSLQLSCLSFHFPSLLSFVTFFFCLPFIFPSCLWSYLPCLLTCLASFRSKLLSCNETNLKVMNRLY